MFKMTVEGETLADLGSALLQAAQALAEIPAAGNAAAPSAEKPSRKTKPSTPDTSAPPQEAGQEPGETDQGQEKSEPAPASETTAEPSVTYDDVRQLVGQLAMAKGRDAAAGVLEKLGVDHASKLTEAQWPLAVEALQKALG